MLLMILAQVTIVISYTAVFLPLMPFDRRDALFSRILHWWASVWLWTCGAQVRFEGAPRLAALAGRPFVLVGNHQSALDIALLVVLCRGRVVFTAKRSLFWIPVFGWWMFIKRITAIDRSSPRKTLPALEKMIIRIRAGTNALAIFAEGTRTLTGKVGPFKLGTFKLVKRAGLPLVPFSIDGAFRALPPGSWRPRAGEIVMRVGDVISADDVARLRRDELLRRVRAFVLETLPADEPERSRASHPTTRPDGLQQDPEKEIAAQTAGGSRSAKTREASV